MNKYNFIFPGQGSQSVGMSSSILNMDISKKFFNQTNELLGYDLLDICIKGPNELLTKTKNTQPAIFTISIIIDSLLKDNGVSPNSVAGHSLGEYSALVSSEVISFKNAIELVILRSMEMEKANNRSLGKMAAILNSTSEDIHNTLDNIDGVVVANYNTEKQIVISGEAASVDLAIKKISTISTRIKCIKLNVSGAFHSPLMKFARVPLSNAINSLNFDNAKVPIYQNINALPTQDSSEIKKNLILQLENPVKWSDTILNIIRNSSNKEFIECGPGAVLTGMNKRIERNIKTYSINSNKNLDELCIKS